jgi:hypothetical protein
VTTWRRGAAIFAFNAALSLLVQLGAPEQPLLSDRAEYDYNSDTPLADNCPNTIYCYRVLVPMALATIPLDGERRWRGLQWLAHTATGTLTALVVSPFASPFIASTLLQTSYAFSFTAYDPYTPDPIVFLVASLFLYFWMCDRVSTPIGLAIAGVFAKETVAVIAACAAVSGLLARDRRQPWRWFVPVLAAAVVLFGFHWYMDTYAGWGIARNPAASFSGGSWLAIWWKNNPSHIRKALMLFLPFAYAWLFAAAGYRHAPLALRQLALGSIAPIAALAYVQTPERALANAFFTIVPLASVFLSRVPPAAAWAAAIANALVTARFGLSTSWLPSTSILLIPASLAAVWAFVSYRQRLRISS